MNHTFKHKLCSGCHNDRTDPERRRKCEDAAGRMVRTDGREIVWCSHHEPKRPLDAPAPTQSQEAP